MCAAGGTTVDSFRLERYTNATVRVVHAANNPVQASTSPLATSCFDMAWHVHAWACYTLEQAHT